MKLKNNIGESFINDKKYDSLKASCQAIAAGLCQTIILFLLVILFSWSVCYSQAVSSKNHKAEEHKVSSKKSDYDWLQFNFDPQHSGNDTKETKINMQNVSHLHQLFKISLPSVADGAPAYLNNVKTNAGTINLVFVTTKDGHIIALNAENGKMIWSHQYGTGNYRINNGYKKTYTTSSPAIDPNRKFVYSYGLDGYVHKYQVINGEEIKGGGWPELCTLKPFNEKGSSALAIATAKNGISYLFVANGGYLGDRGDYQGHLTTINLKDGTQHVFNADCSNQTVHFVEKPGKPDCPAVQNAIWARSGVVYDASTNKIYMATGNGQFNPSDHHWGDAVFALNPDGTGINGGPIDSYTPTDYQKLDDEDLDLGSTAPAVIPTPKNCKIKNLAVQSGKDRILRLINLSNLNGHGKPGYTGGEIGKTIDVPSGEMVFTAPAVWINPVDKESWVFVGTYNGLAAFLLNIDKYGNPGLVLAWKQSDGSSSPIIANGILFCSVSGSIRALNPVTGKLLWKNNNIGGIHWESPIVDNGVLYITDESGNLTAFGL
jgi:outer membrane protein assembly factor BamB